MSDESKAVVRSYYERVINGRDLDAVEEFFADERMVEGVRRGCFSYSRKRYCRLTCAYRAVVWIDA